MKPLVLLLVFSLCFHCNVSGQEGENRISLSTAPDWMWVGEVQLDGKDAFGVVEFTQDGNVWKASGVALALGVKQVEATDVQVAEDEVGFVFAARNVTYSFSGKPDTDWQEFTGTVTSRTSDEITGKGTFQFRKVANPKSIAGAKMYSGQITAPGGATIELAMVIARGPDETAVATLDIPMLGLQGYPLSDLKLDDRELTAQLRVPRGAEIKGTLEPDGLTGVFSQRGMELAMNLKLDPDYKYSMLKRPQVPKRPYPYREREVTATHPNGHTLAGTLTLPDPETFGQGPYPAAILISGGGREDRDSSALGHKPFLIIADYLTRRGVAVMRFDDRGVGMSRALDSTPVGKESTTFLNATDTLAVFRCLRDIEEVDADSIGLIGHSEGGAIAPIVCSQDESVAFAVLMAGPCVRGDKVFRRQYEMSWKLAGASDDSIERCSKSYSRFQAAVAERAPVEKIRAAARQMVDDMADTGLESFDTEESRERAVESMMEFNSPWWQFMFTYDPATTLQQVRCPILAINGTLDSQVHHDQNLGGIEAAMKDRPELLTIRRYQDMNHLFQLCKTGRSTEYALTETTIEYQVLSDICDWILKTTGRQD